MEQSKLSYDQNVIFLKVRNSKNGLLIIRYLNRQQLVFSGDIVILLGLASVKLSIIFFYRRIFSTSRFRLISSIMIGIVVAWLITFFFVSLLRLRNLSDCYSHEMLQVLSLSFLAYLCKLDSFTWRKAEHQLCRGAPDVYRYKYHHRHHNSMFAASPAAPSADEPE